MLYSQSPSNVGGSFHSFNSSCTYNRRTKMFTCPCNDLEPHLRQKEGSASIVSVFVSVQQEHHLKTAVYDVFFRCLYDYLASRLYIQTIEKIHLLSAHLSFLFFIYSIQGCLPVLSQTINLLPIVLTFSSWAHCVPLKSIVGEWMGVVEITNLMMLIAAFYTWLGVNERRPTVSKHLCCASFTSLALCVGYKQVQESPVIVELSQEYVFFWDT